ncbi:MAG: DUF4296 domain-containing protein [Bacteroidales bacterium]|nr:DUF4296 domain-containing protein [Bacteroidales bacterium]
MSKYRLIVGLLLILISFSACRPRKVLSRAEMTDVLYDIHLAEALTSEVPDSVHPQWFGGMSAVDFRDMSYRSVLQKHDITEEIFLTSVGYYSKNLRLYSKIYAKVDERLKDYIDELNFMDHDLPTVAEVLASLKLDTVDLRKKYEYAQFSVDTVPVSRLFLPADSLPSYAAWCTRQWLREPKKKSAAFSMILDPSQIHVADSIAVKDSVLSVDTLSNTKTIQHQDASGEVKKEIVATEARRPLPANLRNAGTRELIHDRFKKRAIENKKSER